MVGGGSGSVTAAPLPEPEPSLPTSQAEHRPAQRPRDRKTVIARHAQALFSERGYNSVPMTEIAQAVGITAGAVYRHYSNKRDLLSDIVNSSQRRFLSALEDLGSQSVADPGRALSDGLVGMAAASLDSEHFAALWQREARHLAPEDQAGMRSRLNEMAGRLRDTIHSARQGLGAVSAEVQAWAVLAIMVSPGHHSETLPRPAFDRFLVSACRAALNSEDPGSDLDEWSRTAPAAGQNVVSRREQILAAAAQAFRRQGYQGVSTDDIGAAAGVAGPALYRHFDAKSDILVALIRRHQEWVAYEATCALQRVPSGEPASVLAALVRSYVRVSLNAPDLLSVTITEWLDLPEREVDALERVRHDNRLAWAHWLSLVRPALSRSDALLLVRTAIILIEDTVRITHLLRAPHIETQLATLALALMRDAAW